MGKVFKYEWKKQLFSKVVIGGILLGLTLLYIAGIFIKKDNLQEWALVLLVLAGTFSSIYVGLECLSVLNKDLKTKESHMLFMVPRSAYQILGAKILASICQILLTLGLFAAAFLACFTAYLAANDGFAAFLKVLQRTLHDWLELDIRWEEITLVIAEIFVSWICMIATGFTAIIAVRTVLTKTRFATGIAVLVFLALNWGINKISNEILNFGNGSWEEMLRYFWVDLGVMAVITVVLLLISGWMAEKKLSV